MAEERKLEGKIKAVVEVLALTTTIFALFVILFGPLLGYLRCAAIFTMLTLILTFIIYPGKSKWEKVNVLDLLFIILTLASMGYIIFNYDYLTIIRMEDITPVTTQELLLGTIALLIILEASRRVVGLPMAVVAVFFILYLMYGQYFPPPFNHYGFSYDWIIEKQYLTSRGIFGLPVSVVINLAYTFVLYGVIMSEMGVIRSFLDFAYRIFGKSRGASAKACISAGTLVGMASGLPMSSTYIIGIPTIPEMIRSGYKPHVAGAIAAVTGTAAQLMPPVLGVAAFVVAQLMNVHYIYIAKMALLPAILFYISFFIVTHLEALKYNVKRIEREIPPLLTVFKEGFYVFLISIAILIYFLVQFYPPGLSAFYASIAAILLGFLKKKNRDPKLIYKILVRTGILSVYIAVACVAAGIIIGTLVEGGLNIKFASSVISIGHQNTLLALILSAVSVMVLGMGMPSIPAYITGASIFVPALVKLGVLAEAAHMFVFYYALLYAITPPVAFAAYAGAQIAKADIIRTGFSAARIGFVTYIIPFIFIFHPSLLLLQTTSIQELLVGLGVATIAIILISIGLTGFLVRPLNIMERLLLLASGMIFIYPHPTLQPLGILLASIVVVEIFMRKDIFNIEILKR